jgi:perosamine synthetase
VSVFIPQMEPMITAADAEAAAGYLQSGGWLTEFRETRAFEASIASFTGARHVIAAPNGTLALFLALKARGIGPGDEVIVPDLTMAASATAVILTGAAVVFADIDPTTLCLDLERAEAAFGPRTKAVMFVSLNGRSPANLAEAFDKWRARDIWVIEDAAQSLGSFRDGRHLGTIGDCGCLSFSSQKLVTTGQGGAVMTDDDELARRMNLLRDFGRSQGGSDNYLSVGWNLKFTDLQAVIGLSQMRRLPELVERKRAIFARYCDGLRDTPGIAVPSTDRSEVTPWFMDVLVDPDRKPQLIAHLREKGIGSRPFYPALHTQPAFAHAGAFPVATRISDRGLWLPSSLTVRDDQIDLICAAVREFMIRF